ncbi:hypothetical protein SNEBB_007099 [Seison nebaliae]|nr:hypothetical protein SNEBB_007099 [Seison nebaliae]
MDQHDHSRNYSIDTYDSMNASDLTLISPIVMRRNTCIEFSQNEKNLIEKENVIPMKFDDNFINSFTTTTTNNNNNIENHQDEIFDVSEIGSIQDVPASDSISEESLMKYFRPLTTPKKKKNEEDELIDDDIDDIDNETTPINKKENERRWWNDTKNITMFNETYVPCEVDELKSLSSDTFRNDDTNNDTLSDDISTLIDEKIFNNEHSNRLTYLGRELKKESIHIEKISFDNRCPTINLKDLQINQPTKHVIRLENVSGKNLLFTLQQTVNIVRSRVNKNMDRNHDDHLSVTSSASTVGSDVSNETKLSEIHDKNFGIYIEFNGRRYKKYSSILIPSNSQIQIHIIYRPIDFGLFLRSLTYLLEDYDNNDFTASTFILSYVVPLPFIMLSSSHVFIRPTTNNSMGLLQEKKCVELQLVGVNKNIELFLMLQKPIEKDSHYHIEVELMDVEDETQERGRIKKLMINFSSKLTRFNSIDHEILIMTKNQLDIPSVRLLEKVRIRIESHSSFQPEIVRSVSSVNNIRRSIEYLSLTQSFVDDFLFVSLADNRCCDVRFMNTHQTDSQNIYISIHPRHSSSDKGKFEICVVGENASTNTKFSLKPQERKSISLIFTPKSKGITEMSLIIISRNENNNRSTATYPLIGMGGERSLSLMNDDLRSPNQSIPLLVTSTELTATFTLKNSSDYDCYLFLLFDNVDETTKLWSILNVIENTIYLIRSGKVKPISISIPCEKGNQKELLNELKKCSCRLVYIDVLMWKYLKKYEEELWCELEKKIQKIISNKSTKFEEKSNSDEDVPDEELIHKVAIKSKRFSRKLFITDLPPIQFNENCPNPKLSVTNSPSQMDESTLSYQSLNSTLTNVTTTTSINSQKLPKDIRLSCKYLELFSTINRSITRTFIVVNSSMMKETFVVEDLPKQFTISRDRFRIPAKKQKVIEITFSSNKVECINHVLRITYGRKGLLLLVLNAKCQSEN